LTGSPRWSPDGNYLAFDSRPEGTSSIYVIASSGGQPKRVTTGPGDNVLPSWSRDGKWIYFASTRSGEWQVWRTAWDGSGAPAQMTRAGGIAPFESLDGKSVYYAKGLNSPGLWTVPTSGGPEEPLVPELKAGWWGCWAVASGGIYYVDPETSGEGANVLLFDPATRRTSTVARVAMKPPFSDSGFSASLDGRWLLVTQTDHSGSDIMLVQNFR
jgi:YD repeat-containing protein